MADRIEWFLNANSSQVRADMTQTVQAVNTGTNQIVQGYNRADLASGSLLKSNSRVASSGIHVAQAMLSGGSAVDIFASSLMGLERATKLPLGALLGLGVAAIAISKIHGVVVEFQALNKEAAELEKKDLTKLKTDELEKAKSEAERISKGLDEQSKGWKGFINKVGPELIKPEPMQFNWRGGPSLRQQIAGNDPWERMRPQRETFAKEQAELYHARRLADIPKEVEAELERRHKDAELTKEATSFKEKLQLSLADIAKGGLHRRDSMSFDNTKQYAGDVAERALKEEALAKKAILGQDYAGAIQHQSLAENLKAQIPGLKDSEKISTFRSALDTSERLRELVQKVTFTNQ
jgi:hypothetical protein